MSQGHLPYIPGSGVPDLSAMTPGEAVRFGTALCTALLAGTPDRGFHGALYPANLRLDAQGRIQLGPPLELGGEFTPDELEYLPPELFWQGTGGPATDVCAVGLLLYTACSGGRPAFTGDAGELTPDKRASAVQRRMKGEEPTPPREGGDELGEVILRAMAFREEERWPDVESLRCALEDCSVFSASAPGKRDGAEVISAALGTAVDAAALRREAGDKAPEPTGAKDAGAKPKAPPPRPVAPGAKNADVVVPAPEPPKPAKPEPVKKAAKAPKAHQKTETPADKPKASAPEKAPAAPADKPKAAPAPEAKPRPARKREAPPAVPDGRPRPVFDAANEKKQRKKRSALPAIATIVALVVIVLVVLYFVPGSPLAPEPETTVPVTGSPAPETETTPSPSVSPETTPSPSPDATPSPSPEVSPSPSAEVTPSPSGEPALSVSLAETGSASWEEAAELCAQLGGHLPVVRNQEDLTALITAAEAAGVSYVWLDAKRDTDGVWRTTAGEEITFFQWYAGEPSGTDTDGTAENYLMLWKYDGVWGYNDMRVDPGTAYSRYYGGRIAVFCQN